MSDTIQFYSRVGDDGVLNVQVNLGSAEAKREVVVTIESLSAGSEALSPERWSGRNLSNGRTARARTWS